MDTAFQNASTRRDQLAAEINQLEQRLENIRRELVGVDRFLEEWKKFAGVVDHQENGHEVAAALPKSESVKRDRPANPPKEQVGDVLVAFLREVGRPATRQRLYSALQDGGIQLQGTDPQMVLSTMLWRMPKRFVRLKGIGYWLADEPWEPANYDPQAAPVKLARTLASFSETVRGETEPREVEQIKEANLF